VSYSFSGFQALNPQTPLPATRVDVEFFNIAAAIDDLVDAVKSVRRADGNLQNGVVSWDGLNDDVKARIDATDARITLADINPSAFSTQVEAETGVANDRLMTPLRTKQQIDALRAFASQLEAQLGTGTTQVLSPQRGLDLVNAWRPYSTQAEAEAGTNPGKMMTPERTKQQLDALRTAFSGSAALTWGSIAAGASATQTITVAGAATGDRVILGLPAGGVTAGLIPTCWVSSANTVTVRLTNITGGGITPAAATYSATAVRF
jgi:hypothetical protein